MGKELDKLDKTVDELFEDMDAAIGRLEDAVDDLLENFKKFKGER